MPAPRKLPSPDELVALRDSGWTLKQIAERYGVSTGAVHLQLKAAGRTAHRPRYEDLVPWRVQPEHDHVYPLMMLRLLARRRAGDTAGVPGVRWRMLDDWLRQLHDKDLVVVYHPDIPENQASSKGGWAYVPRSPEDDDIIRRPRGGRYAAKER